MDLYRIAESFFVYNLVFTIMFILVAAAISILAFKLYGLTKKRQLQLFGLSFLAFALAHAGMFAAELLRRFWMSPGMMYGRQGFGFWPLIMGATFTLYMLGMVLLVHTTSKKKEARHALLLGAVIAAALLSVHRPVMLFHLFATILLFFLVWFYWNSYTKHRHIGNLLVFLAFLFLLAGNLTLVFSLHDVLFFTIGRSLLLAGYGCFLANLVLVFRK